MSNSETARYVHNEVRFGTLVGKNAKNSFVMSHKDFVSLGEVILNHLGERRKDFKLTVYLFQSSSVQLSELNAFLILEELRILADELDGGNRLSMNSIIKACQGQALRSYKVTTHFS